MRELQLRRIDAEMFGRAMQAGQADGSLFAEVSAQATAGRGVYEDTRRTELALLALAEEELESAQAQVIKLEKILPIYSEEEQSLGKLAHRDWCRDFSIQKKSARASKRNRTSLHDGERWRA